MSMRVIRLLEDLDVSELQRIRTTLWQRFDLHNKKNVIEIAFGAAEKNRKLDRQRLDAICFYVHRKRNPRSVAERIPQLVEVRIRRQHKFCLVCMPSDVIEIGQQQVEPTGTEISHARSLVTSIAGCVVLWKLPGQTQPSWGVLSAGHSFAHVRRIPEDKPRVWIASATSPVHRFRGTLLARSRPRDGSQVDASLVHVERSSLVQAALLPRNTRTTGKRIRSVQQLSTDRTTAGYSFPVRTRIPFVVARYLPISNVVPTLGPLRHVLEVNGSVDAFKRGRSGVLWVVDRQVTGLQHAGLPPDFRRGWGQSLETILSWCVEKLAKINRVPTSHIDLRLVRII